MVTVLTQTFSVFRILFTTGTDLDSVRGAMQTVGVTMETKWLIFFIGRPTAVSQNYKFYAICDIIPSVLHSCCLSRTKSRYVGVGITR